MTAASSSNLVDRAVSAWRAGDVATVRGLLGQLQARGEEGGVPWLTVGQLAQAIGDDDAADKALLRQLVDSPRDLIALLLLGSLRARRGDDRAANNFYRTALAVAAQPGPTRTPAVARLIAGAEQFVEAAAGRFGAHLQASVAAAELDQSREGQRVRSALDLLLGRSDLYLQQPSMFYFPELPQRPFFEREEFAWLAELEAAAPAIGAELAALLAGDNDFAPYVQRGKDQAPPANPLLDDPRWSAQYLWRDGEIVRAMADRCPATLAALAKVPMPVIAGRSPMAMFSLLRPGTHIQPHHGLLNTRLICHLPLLAPPGCALRVGGQTRPWQYGETLIFDDSIEHEAWNRGDQLRVVLLFEIWRPELSGAERQALTGIFEAIDTYQGAAVDAG